MSNKRHKLIKLQDTANGDERLPELERHQQKRQRRMWVVGVYAIAMFVACLRYVMQDWDFERVIWVSQWSMLFLAPSLIAWIVQSSRRRFTKQEGGELLAQFNSQSHGVTPGWVTGVFFLSFAASPFLMLLFRDGHALVVIFSAFGGVLLFAIFALWYDGQPVECRRAGLVIDGISLVAWHSIITAEPVKRTNVIHLHHRDRMNRSPVVTDLFVDSAERRRLLSFIIEHAQPEGQS